MPDRLFALIQALTPAEKRRFSLHHGPRAPVSQALFDALAAESAYQERDFLRRHEGAPFHRHYRAHKHALYRILLRMLRDQPRQAGGHAALLDAALDVEVLVGKGLHDAARKRLDRALRDARQAGDLDAELLLAGWDYRLRKARFFTGPGAGDMAAYFRGLERLDERIRRRDALRRLHEESFRLIQGTGEVADPGERARLEACLAEAEALLPRSGPDTPPEEADAALLLWQIRYHAYQGRREPEGQARCMDAMLAIAERHPHLVSERPDWAIAQRNNHLILLHNLGRFDEAEAVDRDLAAMALASPVLEAQRFCALELNRFNRAVRRRDRAALAGWLERVPGAWSRHAPRLSEPLRLILAYSVAYAAYLSGDAETAADWLHRYRDMPAQQTRRTMTQAVIMMQAIVHAELGHEQLADALVRSGRRQLRREGVSDGPEALVLELLHRVRPAGGSRRAWLEGVEGLHRALEAADPAWQRRARVGFDLFAWTAAHRDGRRMWDHLQPY